MPAMRITCLLLGIGLSAFGCATSTGPFAATAVTVALLLRLVESTDSASLANEPPAGD